MNIYWHFPASEGIPDVSRTSFCPSCHQKRVVEFGEWLCADVLKTVPHRQKVFPALDWLAQLTTHVPNRREHMVRYGACPALDAGDTFYLFDTVLSNPD